MANVLKHEKRLEVFAALVSGTSIRRASYITHVHQDTIGRFGFALGVGCERLHNRRVRNLTSPLVDMDEQHSWVGVRQQNLDPTKHDPAFVGEQWTWVAICRVSKLIIAWCIGKRDQAHADALVADVRARLIVMPQITTDGLKLYESSIAVNFGPAVAYAQTVKNYSGKPGRTPTGEKFPPAHGVDFIQKRVISGTPDLDRATTYAAERSNGTNRVWNARLIRRTLCFSKRLDRHCASVALMFVYRAFCHIQRNMRETAAMAAGVTDHVWSLEELMDAALAEPEGEKPEAQPLVIPRPEGSTRELPGDRGWLRVLGGGGKGDGTVPTPGPAAPPAVQVPAVAAAGLGPGSVIAAAPAMVLTPAPEAAVASAPAAVAPVVPVVMPAAPPAAPMPRRAHETPAAPIEPSADATGQLDLLAWRPAPAKAPPPLGTQLDLF